MLTAVLCCNLQSQSITDSWFPQQSDCSIITWGSYPVVVQRITNVLLLVTQKHFVFACVQELFTTQRAQYLQQRTGTYLQHRILIMWRRLARMWGGCGRTHGFGLLGVIRVSLIINSALEVRIKNDLWFNLLFIVQWVWVLLEVKRLKRFAVAV